MDQSNPNDPNQPAPPAPSVPPPPVDQSASQYNPAASAPVQPDLPQAPLSSELPPTPTPTEPVAPVSAPTPPPSWDTPPAQSVAPADPTQTPQPAPAWDTPQAAPAQPTSWDAPAAPSVPATPPDPMSSPSTDWSQPVAPVGSDQAPVQSDPASGGQPATWDSQAPSPDMNAQPPQDQVATMPPAETVSAPESTQSSVDLSNLAASQSPDQNWAQPAQNPSAATGSDSVQTDAAPTDLSSLAAALGAPNINGTTAQPAANSAAPVTTPQAPASAETPTVVTGSHGFHIPKAALIIGAAVGLLAVLGASAYFILGVGQSADTTSAIPTQQQTLTNPPRATIPTPTPIPTLDNGTTLGSLGGATPSAQASPSGTIAPGASSVFDRRATQQ